MSRSEVAAFLREFVDELEHGSTDVGTANGRDDRRSGATGTPDDAAGSGRRRGDADRSEGALEDRERPVSSDASQITFVVGGDSATVTIPETVEFDVEVESRSPLLSSSTSQEVEFHLSWEIEEHHDDDDTIDVK